jgi:hypothetical protein
MPWPRQDWDRGRPASPASPAHQHDEKHEQTRTCVAATRPK